MEAARALGMTHFQGLRFVVIPQSFRLVLPPVTNDFYFPAQDSSLVSMVTLVDLTGAYNRIATQSFDFFGTGLLVRRSTCSSACPLCGSPDTPSRLSQSISVVQIKSPDDSRLI